MNEEMQSKFVFRTYITPTKLSKRSGVSHFSKCMKSLF